MMAAAKIELTADNLLLVSGALTVDTVTKVWHTGQKLMSGKTALEIDLTNVTQGDSSGLALVLAWIREARQRRITIKFKHIPAQLLAIAKVGGLTEIILPYSLSE